MADTKVTPNGVLSVQEYLDMGVDPSNFLGDQEITADSRMDNRALVLDKDPTEALKNLQVNVKRADMLGKRSLLQLPKTSWMQQWKQHKEIRLAENAKQLDDIKLGWTDWALTKTEDVLTPVVTPLAEAAANSGAVTKVLKTGATFYDSVLNFAATAGSMTATFLDKHVGDNRFSQAIHDSCDDMAKEGQAIQKYLKIEDVPVNTAMEITEAYMQYALGRSILQRLGSALYAFRAIGPVGVTHNVVQRTSKVLETISPTLRNIIMETMPALAIGGTIGHDPSAPTGPTPELTDLLERFTPEELKKAIQARDELKAQREAVGDPRGRLSMETLASQGINSLIGGALEGLISGALKVRSLWKNRKAVHVKFGGAPPEVPVGAGAPQGIPVGVSAPQTAPGGVPEGAPVGEPMEPSTAPTVAPGRAAAAGEALVGTTDEQLAALKNKLMEPQVELPTAQSLPDIPKEPVVALNEVTDDIQKVIDQEPATLVTSSADDAAKVLQNVDIEMPTEAPPISVGSAGGETTVKAIKTPLEPPAGSLLPTLQPTKDETLKLANNAKDVMSVIGRFVQGKETPTEYSFELLAKNETSVAAMTYLERLYIAGNKTKAIPKVQQLKETILKHPALVPQVELYEQLAKTIKSLSKKKASKAQVQMAAEITLGAIGAYAYGVKFDSDFIEEAKRDVSTLCKGILVGTAVVYGLKYLLASTRNLVLGETETVLTAAQETSVKYLSALADSMSASLSRLRAAPKDPVNKAASSALKSNLGYIRQYLYAIPNMDKMAMRKIVAQLGSMHRAGVLEPLGILRGARMEPHGNILGAIRGTTPMFINPAKAATLDEFLVHTSYRAQQAAEDVTAVAALKARAPTDAKTLGPYFGANPGVIEARFLANPEAHAQSAGLLDKLTELTKDIAKQLAAPNPNQVAIDLSIKEFGIIDGLLRGNNNGVRSLFDQLPIVNNLDTKALEFLGKVISQGNTETFGRMTPMLRFADSPKVIRSLWYMCVLSRPGGIARTILQNFNAAFGGGSYKRLARAGYGTIANAVRKLSGNKVDPNLTTFGDFLGATTGLLGHLGDLWDIGMEAIRTGTKRYSQTGAEVAAGRTAGVTVDALPRALNADPAYLPYHWLKAVGNKFGLLFRGYVAADEVMSALVLKQEALVATNRALRTMKMPTTVNPEMWAEQMFYQVMEDPAFLTKNLKDASVTMMNNSSFATSLVDKAYRLSSDPSVTLLSPFPKVVFNTLKYIKQHTYSPVSGMVHEVIDKGLMNGLTSPAFEEHVGNLSLGLTAFYLGRDLFNRGILKVANPDTPGTNRALHFLCNSYITTGETRVPLMLLGPVGPLVLMGAMWKYTMNREDATDDEHKTLLSSWIAGAEAVVAAGSDNTLSENISDLFSNRSLDEKVKLFATKFIQGFNPGIVVDLKEAVETYGRSKDLADFLFKQNPWSRTAMDLHDRVLRSGRTTVSLLNDPRLKGGPILGLVPEPHNEIYEEFQKINLNDSTFVSKMDEAAPGKPLTGKALQMKRELTAKYIKENWKLFVESQEYKDAGDNNELRRKYIIRSVIEPALAEADAETAGAFPDYWDIIEANRWLKLNPARDTRSQQETGAPSMTEPRRLKEAEIDSALKRLKLTSGGR